MSDTAQTPVRTREGVELPAPGRWRIDPGHTDVGFVGRHLMFTKVCGRFRGVEGVVEVAENPNDSRVDVTIKMTTVDSGDAAHEEHLRSPDLFDVAAYPTARFIGGARDWSGRSGKLVGDLTIRDATRPVELRRRVPRLRYGPLRRSESGLLRVGQPGPRGLGHRLEHGARHRWLLVSREIQLELGLEIVL